MTNTCVLAGGVHAKEAPASALSSACYAVPETSAVQQPVMKVHSKSTAFCACVDVPVAEQNPGAARGGSSASESVSRSSPVRYSTRPKSRTMGVTRQLGLPPRYRHT